MKVNLDTNIWIFGIVGVDKHCEQILFNLEKFEIVVSDQVRVELERNFSDFDMKQFYQFLLRLGVAIDFAQVPQSYIHFPLDPNGRYPPTISGKYAIIRSA